MKFGFAAAFALALTTAAGAVELNVTHFGTGMYGVPYSIAREKGYFKEIGLDVTGFLTSAAGSATSPYGSSEASALRTVVPPPAEVRKPVTSRPISLKYPFSRAIE